MPTTKTMQEDLGGKFVLAREEASNSLRLFRRPANLGLNDQTIFTFDDTYWPALHASGNQTRMLERASVLSVESKPTSASYSLNHLEINCAPRVKFGRIRLPLLEAKSGSGTMRVESCQPGPAFGG